MKSLARLSSLALRPCLSGIAHVVAEATGCTVAKVGVDAVEKYLLSRFTDRSQELLNSLSRATDRAWACLEVALGGGSMLAWLTRKGEDKAFTATVQAFLDANPLQLNAAHDEQFRLRALDQLRSARKAGLIPGNAEPEGLAKQAAAFSRFTDPVALCDAEWQVLGEIAGELRQAGHAALAQVVELRVGPVQAPLLAVAARFCFHCEIETNTRLFQGLIYEHVDGLRHDLAAGFNGLAGALQQDRKLLDQAFTAMAMDVGRIEAGQQHLKVGQERELAIAVATRDRVAEVQEEIIRLNEKLDRLLDREIRPSDSRSIHKESERQRVREVIEKYRSLSEDERRGAPDLLEAVARLEGAAGDSDASLRDFQQRAELPGDNTEIARAHYGAYLAALERQDNWVPALAELLEAAQLDPECYAPFPLDKYMPERIVGVGGFGVSVLCRHYLSKAHVVVKILRTEELDRDVVKVLEEAVLLEQVEHPAVIRLRDCGFADMSETRPYLVMDYFNGATLDEHIRENGPLSPEEVYDIARQLAAGLKAAHEHGILHRDVKPGNVLVRKTADGWVVKIIDFGLALRPQTLKRASSDESTVGRTAEGKSVSGTIDYASPEQLGKLPGVPLGQYSDVYSFGRTICFAAFGTHQPLRRHWKDFPDEALAELLEQCIEEQPDARPADFGQVLAILTKILKPSDNFADVVADFQDYLRTPNKCEGPQSFMGRTASQHIERWRQAAEQGVAEGAFFLGKCYIIGASLPTNLAEGLRRLRQAADLGLAAAMHAIGDAYEFCYGVGRDKLLVRLTPLPGLLSPYSSLDERYQDRLKDEAIKWYRKAADRGFIPAMISMGRLLEEVRASGSGAPWYTEAMSWYRRAADLGDPEGMMSIANMYRSHRGVERDAHEALRWNRKAADLGHTEAMLYVGISYDSKHFSGTTTDDAEAVRWYRQAAETASEGTLTSKVALHFVAEAFNSGRGVPQDYGEAMRWYRKAADTGDAEAAHRLGMMYQDGTGVAKNAEEARRWFDLAAERGYTGVDEPRFHIDPWWNNPRDDWRRR